MTTAVAYIGGTGRSGSTLLERMLGQAPGYWSVGELMYIWERGLRRNDRCGCGTRFLDCPFWSQVGDAGFGGWGGVDAESMARLRRTVVRHRNLVQMAPGRIGALAGSVGEYRELVARLYSAIRDVSGATVIVDSSKDVAYALLLRTVGALDLRLIHLVRRSHGVVHSWSRQIRQPGVGDGSGYMSMHPPWWSVGLWLTDNLLFDVMGRRMPHATRMRYEDLVASPRSELRRALDELGLPSDGVEASLAESGMAKLTISHALSGNPMRFQTGNVALRPDESWRASMSRRRRLAVSAATWPMLWHYGYLRAPKARVRP
jgi:hypothetical protein